MKFPNLPPMTALTGSEVVPGTQGGSDARTTPQAIANLYKGTRGTDIASASSIDLGAATGYSVHITGTTTITALGTAAAGVERRVIFDGILTLTHNATSLILPTSANITTAAGDSAVFTSEGSGNWRCTSYSRKDGTPVSGSTFSGGSLTSALNEARGTAIASAATTDIGAAGGNFVHITGTTTITALGTIQAGTRRVVTFDGALTLTHNATSLILPGSANITTAAGDCATFVSEGSGNWRCVNYTRAALSDTRADLQGTGLNSGEVGFRNIPQNSQSTAYTLVAADAGKHILHPSADTTARTFTIPANSSVAYPVGTALTFVNQNSAGVVTIAITTDTMRLAGAGTTGSRTLAANGIATALKVTSTEWLISGTGLT